jgi:hypothetical protein
MPRHISHISFNLDIRVYPTSFIEETLSLSFEKVPLAMTRLAIKAPPVLLLHSLGMLSINVAIDVTNGEH